MIEIAKLERLLQAEIAADDWWRSLSPKERKAYLEAHPKSKYARAMNNAAKDSHAKANDSGTGASAQHAAKQLRRIGNFLAKGKHRSANLVYQKLRKTHGRAIPDSVHDYFGGKAAPAKVPKETTKKVAAPRAAAPKKPTAPKTSSKSKEPVDVASSIAKIGGKEPKDNTFSSQRSGYYTGTSYKHSNLAKAKEQFVLKHGLKYEYGPDHEYSMPDGSAVRFVYDRSKADRYGSTKPLMSGRIHHIPADQVAKRAATQKEYDGIVDKVKKVGYHITPKGGVYVNHSGQVEHLPDYVIKRHQKEVADKGATTLDLGGNGYHQGYHDYRQPKEGDDPKNIVDNDLTKHLGFKNGAHRSNRNWFRD